MGIVCPWVAFSGTVLGHAVPRCSILEPFHPFLRLLAFLLARAAAEKGFFRALGWSLFGPESERARGRKGTREQRGNELKRRGGRERKSKTRVSLEEERGGETKYKERERDRERRAGIQFFRR